MELTWRTSQILRFGQKCSGIDPNNLRFHISSRTVVDANHIRPADTLAVFRCRRRDSLKWTGYLKLLQTLNNGRISERCSPFPTRYLRFGSASPEGLVCKMVGESTAELRGILCLQSVHQPSPARTFSGLISTSLEAVLQSV